MAHSVIYTACDDRVARTFKGVNAEKIDTETFGSLHVSKVIPCSKEKNSATNLSMSNASALVDNSATVGLKVLDQSPS